MKKVVAFPFTVLLGAMIFLSPVSNALGADLSGSIVYQSDETQIRYVSEIDEVESNAEIDRSIRQKVKEQARAGKVSYSITPESQQQVEQLLGVHFVENALLDDMKHGAAQKDQLNIFFDSSTKVIETAYTRYLLDGNVSISFRANTFFDVDEMIGSQKMYTRTFPKKDYSISEKLYTSKNGKNFKIYTITDRNSGTVAQYTMFRQDATDYALYVSTATSPKGNKERAESLPEGYLSTLLDNFSF